MASTPALLSAFFPALAAQLINPNALNNLAASPSGGLNLIPFNPFFSRDSGMANQIWSFLQATSATISSVQSSSVPGGMLTQFIAANSDVVAALTGAMIPIDVKKSYFTRIWVAQTASSGGGSPTFYAGFAAYNSSGNLISPSGGTYNYASALGVTPSSGGQWYSGAISGVGSSYNAFPSGTAFIQPIILLGVGLTSGQSVTYQVSTPEFYENVGINALALPYVQSGVFSAPNLSPAPIGQSGAGYVILSVPGTNLNQIYSVGSSSTPTACLGGGVWLTDSGSAPSASTALLRYSSGMLEVIQNFTPAAAYNIGALLIGTGF